MSTILALAPAHDAPEHERARYWREHIARLSRRELSDLTGISQSRIADYEAGIHRGTTKPIDADSMTRYRMICAGVTLGARFNWLTLTLEPKACTIFVDIHSTTSS